MTYEHLDGLSADEVSALAGLLKRIKQPGAGAAGGVPPPTSAEVAQKKTRKKRANEQPKYLNDDELARLFGAVRSTGSARDLAIFEVAYHRGLRASEVGLIQVGQWRQAQQRLYVTRLKNGVSGEYMVTDREARALKGWLKKRPSRPGALFLSRNSKPISRYMLDKLMRKYGAAAGLPADKRHFHCLRHACGTSLMERDVPIEEIQDHLGHKDIRNTTIYAKISNTKRRRKDEKLKGDW